MVILSKIFKELTMEISKELIIKVMDIKYPFSDIQLNSNILSWWREDVFFEETMKINIYEFAFKCKEWALNKGYTIESHTNRSCLSGNNYEYFSIAKIFKGTSSMRINTIEENTEVEAIIKACEWILEQSKC